MVKTWSEPLSVALLQQLSGSLKQNLPQAARLWVWLQLIYGEEAVRLDLPEVFSYADCRNVLFSGSHPTDEAKPPLHDPACLCAKRAADWLFSPSLRYTQAECDALAISAHYQNRLQDYIQSFKQDLSQRNSLPKYFQKFLDIRLFGVTRRTLANDLETLVAQGWLQSVTGGYQRVKHFPQTSTEVRAVPPTADFLVQPDLASIAANLAKTINGQRRFFVHVDYVVPPDRHDPVEDWQAQLGDLWEKGEPPIVQLRYWSATLLKTCTLIVHPVCIYYYRRGPYLCGYGQVPGQNSQLIDWRNYRLDRIQSITPLTWEAQTIPERLKASYQTRSLPEPDEIELRMSQVWGFDYYQPPRSLLLRFDTLWDQRYIQNSLRHPTFQPISFQQAQKLIQHELTGDKQQYLLHELVSRAGEDAYYQATYRHNDPNVRQRLRAWRPHVEVLLPWDLRQQVAAEVRQEMALYVNDEVGMMNDEAKRRMSDE